MPERPVHGRSVVTRRAIVHIVRSAIQGSYGVTGLSDPDLTSRLLRWLGLAERGIRLNRHEGLALDLYITVAYGVPVAEVARQVDSAVRYALRHALAREVDRLTIHIDGLRYQPAPPPAPASPVSSTQAGSLVGAVPVKAGRVSADGDGLAMPVVVGGSTTMPAAGQADTAAGPSDGPDLRSAAPGHRRRSRVTRPGKG